MSRYLWIVWSLVILFIVYGCSNRQSGAVTEVALSCGPGTHEKDGLCLVVESTANQAPVASQPSPKKYEAVYDKAFFDAARTGDVTTLQRMIVDNPGLVVGLDKDGCSAMINAAGMGHKDVVSFLVDNGAEVESRESRCASALFVSSALGRLQVVSYLLGKGANVNGVLPDQIPLVPAMLASHGDVITLLLQEGANVNLRYRGKSMLQIAKSLGVPGIIEAIKSQQNHR